MPKYWNGSKPSKCQICERSITDRFVDGKTQIGPWAIMCMQCSASHGVGIGTGKGQLYVLVEEGEDRGKWLKIEG